MKTFIKNRNDQKVCVVVEGPQVPGKLAYVMHGLGGSKSQPHVRAMAEAFLEVGYNVVTFDATNSFGESDGNYEDATITSFYADLEDVIDWTKEQAWHTEPFVLCGHSLGGISTALYAEENPESVKALAPISTVVSGKLSFETHKMFSNLENLDEWKRQGFRITKSHDGTHDKKLKWSHMEDRLQYDLLPKAKTLTMPVILIVGENDDRTPPQHQKILFDELPGPKEIHVIKNALHSFYQPVERQELKQLLKTWAAKL